MSEKPKEFFSELFRNPPIVFVVIGAILLLVAALPANAQLGPVIWSSMTPIMNFIITTTGIILLVIGVVLATSGKLPSIPTPGSRSNLGLEGIYRNRGEALEVFAQSLESEIKKSEKGKHNARIWFVCSSMRGFIVPAHGKVDGEGIMDRISQSKCDLRILMTDPSMADLRAEQEGRREGAIPVEIGETIRTLKRAGIPREKIKFYPGTPTVFAIATSEEMLLNPYPYERRSHRCFSLIVKNTDLKDDIYNQYLKSHFELPWRRGKEMSVEEWDAYEVI